MLKATSFSAQKHIKQRRKDKFSTPYINHPVSVALVIADIGGVDDSEVLAAALLHDTLEDTETKIEELETEFGKKVCQYVLEVSDDMTISKEERKVKQIEHARHLSKGAALIKLGDKISNVKDVINNPPDDWNLNRRKEYLIWAEKVIDNCPKVNDELENRFKEIVKKGYEVLK
tara:strand:- start:28 stop:549 length:522 start_codon:yes stop_codon:yes gene_type:complete